MEICGHLADTVLFDYLATLVLGVVLLSLLFGVPTAWLVAMCQVPGRRALQWALMLPAMPSYIVAYVYTDLLDYSGPLQAAWLGRAGRLLVPGHPLPRRRRLGAGAGAVPLRLSADPRLLSGTVGQPHSLQPPARLHPWQSFRRLSLPLARPAIMVGHRWWRWRRWRTLPPSTSLPSTP
jgi:iron(III) transport system permease protein